MNSDEINIGYSRDDHRPVVEVGAERVATLPDLIRAAPTLKRPDQLPLYCGALNHLQYGSEYRLILDPDAFRAQYEKRFQAEDPKAPFQEGMPRLRDFGHCDMEEIALPRLEEGVVIFYVEDDYLGIPYRVQA